MKKDLFLMRHGETLFNVQNKVQGWCDSPLTQKGIDESKKMGEKLKEIPFDHFYSSTAERCCDTLELAFPNTSYTRLKGIKERYFGQLEGEPQYMQIRNKYDELAELYGGETTQQVIDRFLSTLTPIMEQEDHQTVFAVSHGGAISCLSNYLTGQRTTRLANSSVLHLSYEDGKFNIVEVINVDE